MSAYTAPVDDVEFILLDVLKAQQVLNELPPFAGLEQDVVQEVLRQSGKFVTEVIAPLNASGDAEGAQWNNGVVTMPKGFKEAYAAFCAAGWPSLSADEAHGGQALPSVLEAILYEFLSAANHAWTMAPALLHGAYETIKHHANDTLKNRFLPSIASGETLTTMCMTEPQAGSDLGLIRTKATPQGADADGLATFALSGNKIFISGGEHDMTENIVHLVLARLPDAPAGSKGLSLFLSPKILLNGKRNGVFCDRIEEKMGIHGSPTCAMRFDNAVAWMVGEPGRGLAAMFVMMNAARMHVALQGIGLLDHAHQKAYAYAVERRQMRAPANASGKTSVNPSVNLAAKSQTENTKTVNAADLIIEHPAVQRLLNTESAWVLGMRVIAYRTALALDIEKHHLDLEKQRSAKLWCVVTTPILKAACTAQGFSGTSNCLQVFGGHGYMREWGIEQILRDARIPLIYEGTNEIQAIDLLLRKVLADGGQGMQAVIETMLAEVKDEPSISTAVQSLQTLATVTTQLVEACAQNNYLAYELAEDYLRLSAIAMLHYAWHKIQHVDKASEKSTVGTAKYQAQALAFQRHVLPELVMREGIILARCAENVEA